MRALFHTGRAVGALLIILALGPGPVDVQAQAPLNLVNPATRVRRLAFKFTESRTFVPEQLEEQIATEAPGFFDTVRRILPFMSPHVYPFSAVELQRDVVRLRNFYNRNGFLHPRITYTASQLDTTHNTIFVLFSILEGPPLIIQDVIFLGPDSSYAVTALDDPLREDWVRFRDRTAFRTGERFTQFELIRIQDQVLSWLQNRGFAFAQINAETDIDSTQNAVDIRFRVDPGPRGTFSEIEVEGNTLVDASVVRRELPFRVGDTYSYSKLLDGQQQLFGLNLFRLVLADIPEQPRDSTVTVRIRVNEARPRYVTAESGYSLQQGVRFLGSWRNRNFLGDARDLTISLTAETGVLAVQSRLQQSNTIGELPPRLIRGAVSLRQPYLFSTKLSGILSPFVEYENDPQLPRSRAFMDINRRELGVNANLIYEWLPFRPLSLQYTLSRTLRRADESTARLLSVDPRDVFTKSILGASGSFGRVDDFLAPGRGVLVRPFVETAGLVLSDIEYHKGGLEVVAYVPLTRRSTLNARLFGGRLRIFGDSENALNGRASGGRRDSLTYEDRFDAIYFYAGGANDVRGWAFQLLGPKRATADTLYLPPPALVPENPELENFRYERLGGTAKIAGNVEWRTPFPGLGNEWRGAVFFDFGQVGHGGRVALQNFKYSLGAGVRYQSIIGILRLDLALKLNPDEEDLQEPEDRFRFLHGLPDSDGNPVGPPRNRFFRRFGLHISIGQPF